ncbi:hypothetical protein [Pedobacter sp.]
MTFAALAILLAVGGAIHSNASKHGSAHSLLGEKYWYDATGSVLQDATPSSKEDRMIVNECHDETEELCERGYDGSQFNTPDVPSSGFRPGQQGNYTPIYRSQE